MCVTQIRQRRGREANDSTCVRRFGCFGSLGRALSLSLAAYTFVEGGMFVGGTLGSLSLLLLPRPFLLGRCNSDIHHLHGIICRFNSFRTAPGCPGPHPLYSCDRGTRAGSERRRTGIEGRGPVFGPRSCCLLVKAWQLVRQSGRKQKRTAMQRLSENTPLVPGQLQATPTPAGWGSPTSCSPQVCSVSQNPGPRACIQPPFLLLFYTPTSSYRVSSATTTTSVCPGGYVGVRGVVCARFCARCNKNSCGNITFFKIYMRRFIVSASSASFLCRS